MGLKSFTCLSVRLPLFFCLVLFLCACASAGALPTATPSAEHLYFYTPTNCLRPAWTYTISLLVEWVPVPPGDCEVQFRDTSPAQVRGITAEDANESEFFAGGVGIRGPIGLTHTDADEQSWISMQPNHSEIVAWQPITTPIGPGRVYTLDRDHVAATRSPNNPTWRVQYAYIPQGDFSYEIWVHAENVASGTIEPTLARMLATFGRASKLQP